MLVFERCKKHLRILVFYCNLYILFYVTVCILLAFSVLCMDIEIFIHRAVVCYEANKGDYNYDIHYIIMIKSVVRISKGRLCLGDWGHAPPRIFFKCAIWWVLVYILIRFKEFQKLPFFI